MEDLDINEEVYEAVMNKLERLTKYSVLTFTRIQREYYAANSYVITIHGLFSGVAILTLTFSEKTANLLTEGFLIYYPCVSLWYPKYVYIFLNEEKSNAVVIETAKRIRDNVNGRKGKNIFRQLRMELKQLFKRK